VIIQCIVTAFGSLPHRSDNVYSVYESAGQYLLTSFYTWTCPYSITQEKAGTN